MLLKYAIKDFQEDREFRQVSSATLVNYMGCLEEFRKYCLDHDLVDVSDITSNTVKSYLIYCQKERKNNPTTINSKLRTLKIFFNYLQEIEIYDTKSNPCAKVRYVRANVKIEVLSDKQISQVFNYYRQLKNRDRSFTAYRNSTIFATFLGTGMRLGELLNLKWAEVDFENRSIIVFGKLKRQTSIPMADKLFIELKEYKLYCIKIFKKMPQSVFVTTKGTPLTKDAVKSMFKRLKEDLNITNVRFSPNDLRHTFAHRFLMNGGDVFTLQKMLRHTSISMSQRYLAIWGHALADRNNQFNPLNNIDL